MEGYAVARECEAHDIPCILLKGVTDFGDSNAKKEIKENITPVSETVADALMYTLEGLKTAKKKEVKRSTTSNNTFMRKILNFIKIEHLIFSLPLLFAGAWLASNKLPSISILLWITLAGLGARTFGMALNRVFDINIDSINPRTANRELVTGALNLKHGLGVAGIGAFYIFMPVMGWVN